MERPVLISTMYKLMSRRLRQNWVLENRKEKYGDYLGEHGEQQERGDHWYSFLYIPNIPERNARKLSARPKEENW